MSLKTGSFNYSKLGAFVSSKVGARDGYRSVKFLIEKAGGGNIPTGTLNISFNIQITAQDNNGNTVLEYSGSPRITSTGTLATGGGTTPPFVNGVLASLAVKFSTTGTFTITATDASYGAAGTSNAFGIVSVVLCAVGFSTVGGTQNSIASADAVNWTTVATPAKAGAVAYSPALRLFCATSFVSGSAVVKVLTSTNGLSWTLKSITMPNTMATGSAIAWSAELGLFVVMGGDDFHTAYRQIMTSPDALNWTVQANADSPDQFNSVVWSKEKNLFCAVGNPAVSGGKYAATSPDGKTWTGQVLNQGPNAWSAVWYSPENGNFCALAGNGANQSALSPDGITWTAHTPPVASAWAAGVWSSTVLLHVIVASDGSIATSPDGITWTSRGSFSNSYRFSSVCWSPSLSLYVAAGQKYLGGSAYSLLIATSPDGSSWTEQTVTNSQSGTIFNLSSIVAGIA